MAKSAPLESRLKAMGSVLREELGPEARVFVFSQATAKSPFELLWSAGGEERSADVDQLLAASRKRQRTVLVYDASKDTTLRDVENPSFSSALCVPILDGTRTPVGMLLGLSDGTGTFSQNQKFAVERLSREWSGVLESYRKEPVATKKVASPFDFLYSPLTLVATAIILFGLVVWSFAPADREPEPEPSSRPNSTAGPSETADRFLASLQQDKYDESWAILAPSLRSAWPSSEFQTDVTGWMGQGANREILAARRPSRVQRESKRAEVILFESSVPGDTGRWNWHFEELQGEWRLIRIEGGPVVSPGPSRE